MQETEAAEETSARPDSGPTAWSIEVPAGPASGFAARANAVEPKITAPSAEGRAQMAVAIRAAAAVAAVVQPDSEKSVSGTLSGFANPGSLPGSSGTVDQITIKIRQA